MLSMPGKNNFGSRFNPYRWSAPVYENPDELIEAIQSARFLSKRLKSVRVIGEARPCFKTKRWIFLIISAGFSQISVSVL